MIRFLAIKLKPVRKTKNAQSNKLNKYFEEEKEEELDKDDVMSEDEEEDQDSTILVINTIKEERI